jgi:hypothetical protein
MKYTPGKIQEQAIRNRFSTRIEQALNSLQKQVSAGRLKNRDKIHVPIGRILAWHPQVTAERRSRRASTY